MDCKNLRSCSPDELLRRVSDNMLEQHRIDIMVDVAASAGCAAWLINPDGSIEVIDHKEWQI